MDNIKFTVSTEKSLREKGPTDREYSSKKESPLKEEDSYPIFEQVLFQAF